MLAYAVLSVRLFPYWEFTTDDARTLLSAERSLRELYYWGSNSSVGVLHPPYVYYLWGFFLRIHHSLFTLQCGILLSLLLAHWILIAELKRVFSARVAYFSSVLAFVHPLSLIFFQQRFWEPACLPLFTVASLAAALRFTSTSRPIWLVAAVFGIAVAMSGHLNAFFFLPGCLLLFWLRGRDGGWTFAWLALLALGVFLCFLPMLVWLPGKTFARFCLAPAIPAGLLLVVAHRFPRWRSLSFLGPVTVGALAVVAAWMGRGGKFFGTLSAMADLLASFGGYLPDRLGHAELSLPWWRFLPEVFFFTLFLARGFWRFRDLTPEKRVFLLWVSLPVFFVLIESTYFSLWFTHWVTFLVPAVFVGCAEAVDEVVGGIAGGRKGAAAIAMAALLCVPAWRSAELVRVLAEGGGEGHHLPTLAVREAVLARVASGPQPVRLSVMIFPYARGWNHDYSAWQYLWERAQPASWSTAKGEPQKFYYVHENYPMETRQDLLKAILRAPGVTEERIGPVRLFASPRAVDGAGFRIP